ncbi:MAG: LuxR C-terminal-related transcriptional regulator, partial [Anaeroplasma sp.]
KLLDRDEVANKLGISTRTLQSHISSIYAKTGYDNLAKLSVYCVSNGFIVPNLETPEQ